MKSFQYIIIFIIIRISLLIICRLALFIHKFNNIFNNILIKLYNFLKYNLIFLIVFLFLTSMSDPNIYKYLFSETAGLGASIIMMISVNYNLNRPNTTNILINETVENNSIDNISGRYITIIQPDNTLSLGVNSLGVNSLGVNSLGVNQI
jgi:hypothetical protein